MVSEAVLLISVAMSLLVVTFSLAFMVFRTLYHTERSRAASDDRLIEAVRAVARLSDKVIDVGSVKIHSAERVSTNNTPGPRMEPVNPFEHISLDGEEGSDLDPTMMVNPTRG